MDNTVLYNEDSLGGFIPINDGRKIALCNYEGQIKIINTTDGEVLSEWKAKGGNFAKYLYDIFVDINEKHLATGVNTITVYDIETSKVLVKYKYKSPNVMCFLNKKLILHDSKGINILDLDSGINKCFNPSKIIDKPWFGRVIKLSSWGNNFCSVAWKNHEKYDLVTWNPNTLDYEYLLKNQQFIIPLNKQIALTITNSNIITHYDFAKNKQKSITLNSNITDARQSFTCSPCGNYILHSFGDDFYDKKFSIWNINNGKMIFCTKKNMPGIPKYLDSSLKFVLSLQSGSSNYPDSSLNFPQHIPSRSSKNFKIIKIELNGDLD